MKMYRIVVCGLICLAVMAIGAEEILAGDKLSFDGQVRLRNEYDLKSTDAFRHSEVFHDLRTRIGLKFEPTDETMVYIQLQDSRRLGDPSSGELTSTNNVDLHQVYFEISDAVFEGVTIKAGRFELNYGNQRMFGSVGWHNAGRSWEGGLLSYRKEQFRFDFFNLHKMEINDEDYNRDFDIFGLYGKFPKLQFDMFAFYESNADTNFFVQEQLKRFNIGGYYHRKHENIDFNLQAVFQFGEKPRDSLPDVVIQDISAFMFATEAGYNFEGKCKARIAAGFDYSSGDDGKDSTKYEAYTNAYYTGHKFRGYMDKFIPSESYGLVDIMLRGKFSPAKKWTAGADFHYFKAAEDYTSLADDSTQTSDIGIELDFTVASKSIKGATVTGGFSVFFADEHYSPYGDDRKVGTWAYLMTTVNF